MTEHGSINIGDVIAGKYRIDRVLGKGAMGVVALANHLSLETDVAIKFLVNNEHGEPEQRFLREARIAGRLKSEHAARAMDMGVTDTGVRFIVMEYIEGEDLSAFLDRVGGLPVKTAILFVLQACHALAEAHSLGIVHRDIKPSNMMLTMPRPGVPPIVKVLDFGVSKAVGALGAGGTQEARLTATASGIGSPLYMAPEQINNAANVDARADIWSLGVTLYQLLTKTTPWLGDTIIALISNMVRQDPTPIGNHRPDVPAGLATVIEQCLERDRSRRWPNVASFAAALAPYGPPESEALVASIAARHGLPDVQPERPTEPMPEPGTVAANLLAFATAPLGRAPLGAVASPVRPALASPADAPVGRPVVPSQPDRDRLALASRRDAHRHVLGSRPDAAPVSAPARSSAGSAREASRSGRRIAIGLLGVAAAFIVTVGARRALVDRPAPEPVGAPITVPPPATLDPPSLDQPSQASTAEACAPVVTPAPSSAPTATLAPSTTPTTAPSSAVLGSPPATARPTPPIHPASVQPPHVQLQPVPPPTPNLYSGRK